MTVPFIRMTVLYVLRHRKACLVGRPFILCFPFLQYMVGDETDVPLHWGNCITDVQASPKGFKSQKHSPALTDGWSTDQLTRRFSGATLPSLIFERVGPSAVRFFTSELAPWSCPPPPPALHDPFHLVQSTRISALTREKV